MLNILCPFDVIKIFTQLDILINEIQHGKGSIEFILGISCYL